MEIKEKMMELQREIEVFSQEKEGLSIENSFLKKLVGELESKFKTIHEAINRCACIGLTDLDNKIKEAEYNALNFFEKKCPYCGNGVFDGHIRNKINVDHFWPIAKGGQHVPWNILPVCGRCNKKKKDNLPSEFLGLDRYVVCLNYLESVRNKYGNETQTCVEMIAQIKGSILSDAALPAHEAIKRLYNIFGMPVVEINDKEDIVGAWLASGIIKTDDNEFIPFKDLYENFIQWYQETKDDKERNKPSRRRVSDWIKKKGFKKERKRGGIIFHGLRLLTDLEKESGSGLSGSVFTDKPT